jgi:hypothetical protein
VTDPKMLEARDALRRRLNANRSAGERLTPKNVDALLELQERYTRSRKLLRASGQFGPLSCVCKADRIELTCATYPRHVLKDLGYRNVSRRTLWGQKIYRFVDRYRGEKSIREITAAFEPRVRWAPACRLTLIPRDATGGTASDLQSLWERTPVDLMLLELAFDFPFDSVVDVDFIRRHFLSGKMHLKPGSDPFHERFPGASRTMRVYTKWEIASVRLELEIHSRLLRTEEVRDFFGFQRLADHIVPGCAFFAMLNRPRVTEALKLQALSADRIEVIEHALDVRSKSLCDSLQYLRSNVGLKNTRRLLSPLNEINGALADAVRKWAAGFPSGAAVRNVKTGFQQQP